MPNLYLSNTVLLPIHFSFSIKRSNGTARITNSLHTVCYKSFWDKKKIRIIDESFFIGGVGGGEGMVKIF